VDCMSDTHELTVEKLALARRTVEQGRNAADVQEGYANFDLALAIIDGCSAAMTMADAHDPKTIIQQLESASAHLALVQADAAESSVKTARQHIDATIATLLRTA
jgi:hypothetical protein